MKHIDFLSWFKHFFIMFQFKIVCFLSYYDVFSIKIRYLEIHIHRLMKKCNSCLTLPCKVDLRIILEYGLIKESNSQLSSRTFSYLLILYHSQNLFHNKYAHEQAFFTFSGMLGLMTFHEHCDVTFISRKSLSGCKIWV